MKLAKAAYLGPKDDRDANGNESNYSINAHVSGPYKYCLVINLKRNDAFNGS